MDMDLLPADIIRYIYKRLPLAQTLEVPLCIGHDANTSTSPQGARVCQSFRHALRASCIWSFTGVSSFADLVRCAFVGLALCCVVLCVVLCCVVLCCVVLCCANRLFNRCMQLLGDPCLRYGFLHGVPLLRLLRCLAFVPCVVP
jgi:hypothetical protein